MRLATLTVSLILAGTGTVLASGPYDAAQPAPVKADALTDGRVLVLPFEQLGGGPAGSYDWIGRAVQQNLVTELGRVKTLSTVAPARSASTPAADVKAAVEAGRDAGAEFVVCGSFQLNDQDLRLNGQVVHVEDATVVGTLKSTGTVRDLFAMEDTVATQAKRLIAPPPAHPVDTTPPATATTAPQQPAAQPQVAAPANNTYASNYNRYTYYPMTGYYYPGYYYPSYGYGWHGYGYGYGGYYGGYYPVTLNTYWTSLSTTPHQPIGVGTSQSMVARGMISVGGNFLPNGQLAK